MRHDFNDGGAGGAISNGTALNLGFNVPGFNYLHGYLEANLGGNSEQFGGTDGPTWKGQTLADRADQQRPLSSTPF